LKLTAHARLVTVCGRIIFADVPVRVSRSSVVLVVRSITGSQKHVHLEVANQPHIAYAEVDIDARSVAAMTT
jgi:hypothetical protein